MVQHFATNEWSLEERMQYSDNQFITENRVNVLGHWSVSHHPICFLPALLPGLLVLLHMLSRSARPPPSPRSK